MREPFPAIVAELTAMADILEEFGAEAEARAVRRCAELVETRAREWVSEALTLEEAATETGFSYSALEKLIRRGQLPNVGRKGRPRIRRGDLPRKPAPPKDAVTSDLADRTLAGRVAARSLAQR